MGSSVVPDNIATLLMVFAGSSAPLGAVMTTTEILSGAICTSVMDIPFGPIVHGRPINCDEGMR
jgi:hypothetical protein